MKEQFHPALLYGQLPLALNNCPLRSLELLALLNEDGEPVASLYRKIPYVEAVCRQGLMEGKFRRDKDEWHYPAVEQALSLTTLLQNLRTFAINETEKNILLLPVARAEFKHLLSLLYDHPAVEFAADALWQKLIGSDQFVPDEEATHIGPSVAMLLRLNLRYRNQQHNSMIFRDPAEADAHEVAMKQLLQLSANKVGLRLSVRLTGMMRLLDRNWSYTQPPLNNNENLIIQTSPRGQGSGLRGGLLSFDALKLHPESLVWFAWLNNREELERLHQFATLRHSDEGRFPVMAFTASTHLMEQYNRGDVSEKLKDDLLLYYLNPSEVDQLERIGLSPEQCKGFVLEESRLKGFVLEESRLTIKFKNKLNALREFSCQAIQQWRLRLNRRGLIAWPLKPSGKINVQDRALLLRAWTLFAVEEPGLSGLNDLETRHGIDAEEVAGLMQRLALPDKFISLGFSRDEHAGLFSDMANPQQAQAHYPHFLARIANPAVTQEWTMEKAKRDWYWGYLLQSGMTAKNVFDDWMWWCSELHLLQLYDATANHSRWQTLPRAKLDNAIVEAKNWFEGNGADGYRTTVAKLERVFGYDKIPGLFAPLGKFPMGTETVEANDQLQAARKAFDKLKVDEESLCLLGAEALDDIAEKLPTLLQGRSAVLKRVSRVKPERLPTISLGNINTLRLYDKEQSLYQRIEQARLFAEFVDRSVTQIRQHIDHLISDIDTDSQGLTHFPRSLFTLSLQTVNNILDGALQQQNASDTATTEGTASSDTLLHYLRSLQLDKAAERLRLLGEEAGIAQLDNATQQGFTDNSGQILSAYRACKEKYLSITDYLAELQARCKEASHQFEPLPADYPEAAQPGVVVALIQKLHAIEDCFEDLAEAAKTERERFRDQARKGQFKAISEIPDRLLKPIQIQMYVIGGDLSKIENAIKSYRNKLIGDLNEQVVPALKPLFAACNEPAPEALMDSTFAPHSLHELRMALDVRRTQWEKNANQLLNGTGIDFTTWQNLASVIAAGKNPVLAPSVQEALVSKGILKMRLYFGSNV